MNLESNSPRQWNLLNRCGRWLRRLDETSAASRDQPELRRQRRARRREIRRIARRYRKPITPKAEA